MNIKILGPGCARCHALEKAVKETVQELELDATIEYVKEMTRILEYPILTTPGLVIDEKVVSSGKTLSKDEVKKFITDALDK
jgi:small redox-active disulfide protein 2